MENNNDNFIEFHIVEILENSTKEQRLEKEEFWIQQYIENNIKLYNNQLKPTKKSKSDQIKSKIYEVNLISPTGEIVYSITNFKKFCEDHNMSRRSLQCLLDKKCRSIKGCNSITK
jgi:hypothetical protein